MIYSDVNNSPIDLAIQSLEREHQLKKEKLKSGNTPHNLFRGSDLFAQPWDSMFTPLLQIQSALRESATVIKSVFNKIQQEVKQSPWALLAKIAMGSFGFGLIVSRRMSARTKERK